MAKKLDTREDYLRRFPRICAHIISESLGYATPTCAAQILEDAHKRQENWCEYIYSCYNRDPVPMVKQAIERRKSHKGFMADYQYAYALVKKAIDTGQEPLFASWF